MGTLSSADGHFASQLAAEVAAWARPGTCGALEVAGEASGGTIYLSHGFLCFAESGSVPDLGSRLVNSGQLPADRWDDLIGRAGAAGNVGDLLIGQSVVTRDGLQALLLSITLDALTALAGPPPGRPGRPGTRFRPAEAHWSAGLLRLDPAAAWAAVERTARRLSGFPVPAGARPRLSRPGLPTGLLPLHGPREIAGQIDGLATVGDLAWRNGFALCDVREWVGALGQAGLCTLAPGPAAAPLAAATAAPLPRRTPGAALTERPPPHDAPHPDLLRRVLHGLQRMG